MYVHQFTTKHQNIENNIILYEVLNLNAKINYMKQEKLFNCEIISTL